MNERIVILKLYLIGAVERKDMKDVLYKLLKFNKDMKFVCIFSFSFVEFCYLYSAISGRFPVLSGYEKIVADLFEEKKDIIGRKKK